MKKPFFKRLLISLGVLAVILGGAVYAMRLAESSKLTQVPDESRPSSIVAWESAKQTKGVFVFTTPAAGFENKKELWVYDNRHQGENLYNVVMAKIEVRDGKAVIRLSDENASDESQIHNVNTWHVLLDQNPAMLEMYVNGKKVDVSVESVQ